MSVAESDRSQNVEDQLRRRTPPVTSVSNKTPNGSRDGQDLQHTPGNRDASTIEDNSEVPKNCSNFYCRLVVHRPACMLAITLFIQTMFPVLSVMLHAYGSDVFPADFSDVPLNLEHSEAYKRVAAWNRRNKDPENPIYFPPILTDAVKRQIPADVIELFFVTKDGSNILTADYLRSILEFEDSLVRMTDYKKFCVVRDGNCVLTRSLARMLGGYLVPNAPNYFSTAHDTASDNRLLQQILYSYSKDVSVKSEFLDFLGVKEVHWRNYSDTFSNQLRSYLFVAFTESNEYGRRYTTKDFASEVAGPALLKLRNTGIIGQPNIDFFYYNGFLHYDFLRQQVIEDMFLVIGSFLFILAFMWIQTQSLFVTVFGMYGIVTNFFAANLIYRYIFDYQYFGVFHVLSIFIILGIGVDDIFVFSDAWVTSAKYEHLGLAERLTISYRKSGASMFVTSFSTAIAFSVNAFSPLLAIGSFGLYSALHVVTNFISVVTYFPAVIIFQHLKFRNCVCCCQPGCVIPTKLFQRIKSCGLKLMPKLTKLDSPYEPQENGSTTSEKPSESKGSKIRVSQILFKVYLQVITNLGVQVTIFASTVVIIIFLSWSATKLSVDSEPVKLYRDSHPLGYALTRRNSDFTIPYYTEDEVVQIKLIWGIKGFDRSNCHKTNWRDCYGNVIWDENFNMNLYQSQHDIINLCDTMKKFPPDVISKLLIKTHADGKPELKCFLADLQDYIKPKLTLVIEKLQGLVTEYKKSLTPLDNLTPILNAAHEFQTGLPTSDVKVHALMSSLPQIYNLTLMQQKPYFDRYFETALMMWLDDAASVIESNTVNVNHWRNFGGLIGQTTNSKDLIVTKVKEYTVTYGTRLRYFAIAVNLSMPSVGYPFREGLQVFENWEQFLNEQKRVMSPNLQNGYVVAPDRNEITSGMWHWMQVQLVLTNSAVSGIVVSLSLALPILTFSTNDVLIGLLATITIGCATISVIGVIPLVGWKLGVLESMNLTLVVGLAIDYIVHVAEAFHLSPRPTRLAKMEQVIMEVGVSVASGALSTLGASFFLLFAQIVFFMQFGLFIFCTVAFSLFYSLGFFTVLLLWVGPETDRFSLKRLVWKPIRRALAHWVLQSPIVRDGDEPDGQGNRNANIPVTMTASTDLSQASSVVSTANNPENTTLKASRTPMYPDDVHYTTDSTLPVSTDETASVTSNDSIRCKKHGQVGVITHAKAICKAPYLHADVDEGSGTEQNTSGYESSAGRRVLDLSAVTLKKFCTDNTDSRPPTQQRTLGHQRLKSAPPRRPPSVLRRMRSQKKIDVENIGPVTTSHAKLSLVYPQPESQSTEC